MKITELRKLLNTTSDADLKKSIVEIYKLLPKNKMKRMSLSKVY